MRPPSETAVKEFIQSFEFLMDSSLLGIGVGFDTKGKDTFEVFRPNGKDVFVVPDTREGWVDSLRVLLESYLFPHKKNIEFDYTKIRPPGTPLKTFGGVCQGSKPLQELHESVRQVFETIL